MNKELIEGRPMSVILKFTIPLLIGNIFSQLYNMADTIIVGRFVGQNALAAVGSTGTIMFLVQGLATGLTTGFTVLTSQRYGAGDERGTRKTVANGGLLAIIIIVFFTLVSVTGMKPVLRLMNTPDEIFDDAYTYITIICLGIVCTVFYNYFSSLMRAVGNSKMPLVFLVFSACLNVFLDLLLIVNFHMGVAGAAVATDIAQGISALLSLFYIVWKMNYLVPEKGMWHIEKNNTIKQLKIGVPMALQFGITASGTMIMQTAINGFGAVAVASYTAACKIQNILMQGHYSLGQTMASYGGQNYGYGSETRIRKGVKAALIIALLYSALVALISLPILRPLMGLFFSKGTDIGSMMPYAVIYTEVCMVFYVPLGMIFIFRNIMQGCGYGLLPMAGGIVELICRLSMAFLSMHFHSYTMAAFCDPFAWIGAGTFTAIAYLFVIKRVHKDLLHEKEP